MDKQKFDYLEVEAALCVWECINDWTLDKEHGGKEDWIELRGSVGSTELRHQSIELGQWCLEIFNICTKDDPDFFEGIAYDWEVIPMILNYARNEDGLVIYRSLLRRPEDVAPLVMAEHKLNEFISIAQHWAAILWGYRDLIDDHPDHVQQAAEANEDPKKFVKWLGEKYGLTKSAL